MALLPRGALPPVPRRLCLGGGLPQRLQLAGREASQGRPAGRQRLSQRGYGHRNRRALSSARKDLPWRVFLGRPACISPVSRLYLAVSMVSCVSLYRFYIDPFCSRCTVYPVVSHCIQLYPTVSSCIIPLYLTVSHRLENEMAKNTLQEESWGKTSDQRTRDVCCILLTPLLKCVCLFVCYICICILYAAPFYCY